MTAAVVGSNALFSFRFRMVFLSKKKKMQWKYKTEAQIDREKEPITARHWAMCIWEQICFYLTLSSLLIWPAEGNWWITPGAKKRTSTRGLNSWRGTIMFWRFERPGGPRGSETHWWMVKPICVVSDKVIGGILNVRVYQKASVMKYRGKTGTLSSLCSELGGRILD